MRDPARAQCYAAIHLLERGLDIVERRRNHPSRGFVWTSLVDPLDLVVGDAREVGRVSGTAIVSIGGLARVSAASPAVALSCGCAPRCRRASGDTLYLVYGNSIELGDLRPRHPVARQGADTTELGGRYLPGFSPDHHPSPYRLRFGRRLDLRCTHRHQRRDREDTWLAPRLVLS